jgi:hypothetical protein
MTKTQRAIAIIGAFLDTANPDVEILTKIADAFAYTYRRGETLPNQEKAGVFLDETRAWIKLGVKNAIESRDKAAVVSDSDVNLGTG